MSEIDPTVSTLLARLDARAFDARSDPLAQLDELDLLASQIHAIAGPQDRTRDDLLEEVEQLRLEALKTPRVLPALRAAIAAAKRELGAPTRAILSAEEHALARSSAPPLRHMVTPFRSLNDMTRGGLLERRLTSIVGEPDAGKTALLVQLALHASRLGHVVAIHCVDEPREGIIDRLGQAFGLVLEDLEAASSPALVHLAQRLRELPGYLHLVDQDEDGLLVEDTADEAFALARRRGASGVVFCVDSIQTASVRAHAASPRTDRERIDHVVAALRRVARRGAWVLATSETSRASHGRRKVSERVADMAAAKGSGTIEFASNTVLVLSRIGRGEHAGDVRIGVPKNKRGLRGLAIRLARDPDRCTYTDHGYLNEREQSEREEQPTAEPVARVNDARLDRARHVLRAASPPMTSIERWVKECGGKSDTARAACRELVRSGEVIRVRENGVNVFRFAPAPEKKS